MAQIFLLNMKIETPKLILFKSQHKVTDICTMKCQN